jgi:hypothetical protein
MSLLALLGSHNNLDVQLPCLVNNDVRDLATVLLIHPCCSPAFNPLADPELLRQSSRMLSWCTQHAMLAWAAHAATSPLFHHPLPLVTCLPPGASSRVTSVVICLHLPVNIRRPHCLKALLLLVYLSRISSAPHHASFFLFKHLPALYLLLLVKTFPQH